MIWASAWIWEEQFKDWENTDWNKLGKKKKVQLKDIWLTLYLKRTNKNKQVIKY